LKRLIFLVKDLKGLANMVILKESKNVGDINAQSLVIKRS
jgi:hypothetical protein